jgi:hypothetical protein
MGKRNRHSAAKTGAPVKSAGQGRPADTAGGDGQFDRALAELWAAIAAGDVLRAELQTSAFAALPFRASDQDAESEAFVDALIDAAMEQQYGPVSAAFMRLLMTLGPRIVKRAAGEALAELTGDGVYPPEWVTGIGKPVPGQAWRVYDVFGDRESVVVTFSYPGETEHALLAGVDLAGLPSASVVGVTSDAAGLLKTIRDAVEPFERFDEISLADARRRIEVPLAHAGEDQGIELDLASVMQVPIARSRVRRLPSGDAGAVSVYTAADRAAAVDEFLRGPQAAEAGNPEVARFWAEVLTGYSSRLPGEPPALVGPLKLAAMLLGHTASTFTLSAAQREGLEAAVSAWVRWTAVRRDLDEAAAERLLTKLPEILDEFQTAYDDPDSAAARAYVRDVAASDMDVAWLAGCRTRREFAVPPPWDRDPGVAPADATDPAGRAVLTAYEFASCTPEGPAGEKFMAAAKRVVEELWHDDPAETWQAAERLLARGETPHDVLHALAGHDIGR